ncbi:MAG: anti-sigma factor [bacterium]|nr:anti-sigma factor [bacterium]
MLNKCKKITDCKYHQELIHKRLDGEISPEENRELDEHLADCPECFDELTQFAAMQDLIGEVRDNPVEVPEGFFENLARQLDDVAPARGISGLLAHPFFMAYRNWALATTSFILVAVLVFSVGTGFMSRMNGPADKEINQSKASVMIMTNNGEAMVLSGDEGDPDRYSRAIDDLEMSYREAAGQSANDGSEGYIHTEWHGGESATPIN